MLILPIKKKWFDMILSGKKKKNTEKKICTIGQGSENGQQAKDSELLVPERKFSLIPTGKPCGID